MSKIAFLYILLLMFSCHVSENQALSKAKCRLSSNNSFISKVKCYKVKANNIVGEQMRKNKINLKNSTVVYYTYALPNKLDTNEFKKNTFTQNNFLDSISFSPGFSSFMFLDKSGKYVAKSSGIHIYTDMSQFKFYNFDKLLIDKYLKRNYEIMFELWGFCRNTFIFGYSKDSLEIFEYKDNTLIPIRFDNFKSKCKR